jgi:hypothetical protein
MSRIRHGLIALAVLAPSAAAVSWWMTSSTRSSLTRVEAPDLRANGISGVARDDRGRLWAVSEERHELVRFEPTWDLATIERFPISGILQGLELESAAWLGAGTFALGTETDDERDEDAVLIVRIDGDGARVVASSHVSWRTDLGVAAPHNAGIEGLCAAGGLVLAAGEMVLDGPRRAPLALAAYDGATLGPWRTLSVELTSATGKISALDCAEGERGSLVVHAVERHYGVTRVLRFTVPETVPSGAIVPEIVSDVSALASDLPNVEGIIVEDDRFVLLSDHDSVQEVGTTEILNVSRVAGVAPTMAPPTASLAW